MGEEGGGAMTRRGLSYTIRCAECGKLADDVAAVDALRVIEEHHIQYPLHVVSHKMNVRRLNKASRRNRRSG